ncbi:hypothetical protein LSUE1_G000696 [Lachnellula suecica]|uniref:CSEP0039 effector protein n=1 Tax=Lachnellula suecica TaxID=602035 RepID=A0A8T9CKM5_9HELO|nr:hypothetical protein LSUE1_G000696 [Lachnellula suecica]
MHSQALLFYTLLAASTVTALPLNINLGAYSPALVVGDGEISFGGKESVSNLMNALEGAAVSSAAANGAAAPAAAAAPATATPAPAAAAIVQPQAQPQAQVVPTTESTDQAQAGAQIASLQGMGKEIAPRVVPMKLNENVKRDITGFNAALKYAAGALTTGPKIELGTENAGIGILQSAGSAAPAAAAPAAAAPAAQQPAAAKRDEPIQPKLRTTVTTMFVRGGPAPAAEERSIENGSVAKRAPSPVIDGVNLNMAEGQVAELTFVETRAVGDEAAEDDE